MNIELADLAALVGLGADADKEAVLGSLKAKLAPTKPEPVTAFSVLVDGKEQRFGAAEILALSAEVSQLKADLKNKLTSAENAELEQAVKAFSAEGKVPLDENRKPIAVETLKTFSVAELKRLLANTPKTVALSASAKIAQKPAGELKGLARAAAALNAQFANS